MNINGLEFEIGDCIIFTTKQGLCYCGQLVQALDHSFVIRDRLGVSIKTMKQDIDNIALMPF